MYVTVINCINISLILRGYWHIYKNTTGMKGHLNKTWQDGNLRVDTRSAPNAKAIWGKEQLRGKISEGNYMLSIVSPSMTYSLHNYESSESLDQLPNDYKWGCINCKGERACNIVNSKLFMITWISKLNNVNLWY